MGVPYWRNWLLAGFLLLEFLHDGLGHFQMVLGLLKGATEHFFELAVLSAALHDGQRGDHVGMLDDLGPNETLVGFGALLLFEFLLATREAFLGDFFFQAQHWVHAWSVERAVLSADLHADAARVDINATSWWGANGHARGLRLRLRPADADVSSSPFAGDRLMTGHRAEFLKERRVVTDQHVGEFADFFVLRSAFEEVGHFDFAAIGDGEHRRDVAILDLHHPAARKGAAATGLALLRCEFGGGLSGGARRLFVHGPSTTFILSIKADCKCAARQQAGRF